MARGSSGGEGFVGGSMRARRAGLAGARGAGLAGALLLAAWSGGCGGINVVRKQKLEFKGASLPLRTFAFPSGLRVVVERDTRTQLAGVFLVVGSGSSSDPAGKEGLAHYVEHLAFQSRPFGAESFSDLLDKGGAVERNASTDFDSTTYFEIGPASALPQLLRIEGVRMVVPVSDVPDRARTVELDVVQNELRERNETGFIGDVYSRLLAAVFPSGHPYARPIGGSHQSVATFTQADTDSFAKTHYRPSNMTLVLLGNIDLDRAEALLADTLPGALVSAPSAVKLPERLSPAPPAVPEPPPAPAALPRVQAAIAAPELWVGWSLPRGFDRDGYLLSFLSSAARGQLSGLLEDDRDIASVRAYPVPGKEASMLLVQVALHAAADPEKTLDRVLREVPKSVNQFLTNPDDLTYSREVLGSRYTFSDQAYSRARRSVLVGELKVDKFNQYALPFLTAARARAVLFVPTGTGTGAAAATGDGPAPGERLHGRASAIRFQEYVLPFYQRLEREPHHLATREFFEALLPGNPFGRTATLAELEGSSPGAATAWLERTYAPDNATLVVAGEFEPAEVQRFIEESFGRWKPGAPDAVAEAPAPPLRAQLARLSTPRPGASQGEVRFGCRLPAAGTGAVAARHALAAQVAQDSLWAVLRERLGASYGVHVQATVLDRATAWLEVRTNVENGKLEAVLAELQRTFEKLAAAPADEGALGWARYEEASAVALGQMTNHGLARSILQRTQLGFPPELAELRRELGAVNAQDLQDDFKACLASNPTLSIVGEEAVVQAALKSGWR